MDHFDYRERKLYAESVPVETIVEQYGTPTYIYSRATLERHWRVFSEALSSHPHKICYSVKANSNLAVLDILAKLGSGFDIVSQGELERVLAVGADPNKIVFSGIGKNAGEIRRALSVGIYCFNVESESELHLINEIAIEEGTCAPISLRINPDVDAKSHPYISTGLKENKFGIDIDQGFHLYRQAAKMRGIHVTGVDCHIGSQLTSLEPFVEALSRLLVLVDRLNENGITIEHLDVGGGLGVRYQNESPPSPVDYAMAIRNILGNRNLEIIIEPGRAIAANAGILVTKVEHIKTTPYKNFGIVDAGMNDFMRPALYQAWHDIIPIDESKRLYGDVNSSVHYDIVGPVCESADSFGANRPLNLSAGDLLAIRGAGAYGFVMSSNYNSRPRPAEVVVDNDRILLARPRETLAELFKSEAYFCETP